MSTELRVRVVPGVWLECGRVELRDDVQVVLPPERPLFAQVVEWLESLPPAPSIASKETKQWLAMTALCLRWGTWLAWTMDPHKPPAPELDDEGVSQVRQDEMARINIEASANLERLFHMRHEAPQRLDALLAQAASYLPMPSLKLRRHDKTVMLTRMGLLACHLLPSSMPVDGFEEEAERPDRTAANYLMFNCYRNGPIEDCHAGRYSAPERGVRRFTGRQVERVLKYTAERLGPCFMDPLPWRDIPKGGLEDRMMERVRREVSPEVNEDKIPWSELGRRLASLPGYPRDWSLTEASRTMALR